jgi:hypothetical protein
MMHKTNEGLLQLEMALSKSPKWLNKFVKFYPEVVQDSKVMSLLSQYKKDRKRKRS